MADENGKTGDEGQNAGDGQDQTVQIGEKAFTLDELTQIVGQRDAVTQAAQETKAIKDLAASYDLTPQQLAEQTQGAFAVITNLADKGVVDPTTWEPVKKEANADPASPPTSPGFTPPATQPDGKFAKALEAIDSLTTKVDQLSQEKDVLMQAQLEDRITGQFKNLTRRDASQLIQHAATRRGTDVMELAEGYSKTKDKRAEDSKTEMRKQILEEMGLPEDFNPKAAEEARNTPAADVVAAKKKVVSWLPGENKVAPRDLTKEIFDKRFA